MQSFSVKPSKTELFVNPKSSLRKSLWSHDLAITPVLITTLSTNTNKIESGANVNMLLWGVLLGFLAAW